MTILGLHHITLVCSNAQQTVDFYTRLLGLRLVKQTVNFDDPESYHLYFGDSLGRPGTAITFFEWPHAPKGYPGIGGTDHFALTVETYEGLLQWKRWFRDQGLKVNGPYDRHYFRSLYVADPDGVKIEIATRGPGWTVDEPADALGSVYCPPPPDMIIKNRDEAGIQAEVWPDPLPAITPAMALTQGMHHISAICSDIQRTHAFLNGFLGLRRVKMTSNFDDPDSASAHWYWGMDDGQPGTLMTYFERQPATTHRAVIGIGQTHHVAFAVADDATQQQWCERFIAAGLPVSPIMDRVYFKSIYSSDPDGHIVELATVGPGFTVDEAPENLGEVLRLPPWLEQHRNRIESQLTPLQLP